jgi:hypothetical protein
MVRATDAAPLDVDAPDAVTGRPLPAAAALNVAMLPIHGDDVLSVDEKLNVAVEDTASYP